MKICTALTLVLASTAAASPADSPDKRSDLYDKLHDSGGDYARPLVVTKLTKMALSKSCWDKMLGDEGVHAMGFFTLSIVNYAKRAGFGDWDRISGDGATAMAENKPKVEKLVAEMSSKFGVTLVGDLACDTRQTRLLLGYFGEIGTALDQGWTPASGKAFITVTATASAKDVTVSISKDGTQFTITGPADDELPEWDTKILKGLAKGGKKP